MNREEPNCLITFEKMSKSKGNGVAPEDVSKLHGVDALRAAMLFAAPPESDLNFEVNSLASMSQFLKRVQKMMPTVECISLTDLEKQVFNNNSDVDNSLMRDCLNLLIDFEAKIE